MQITFEGFAYLDGQYGKLDDILSGRRAPSIFPIRAEYPGFVYLGPVTIITECGPTDDIVAGQIETLRAQLQTVRAENQQRENAILDQISKLQALTFESA